MLESNISLSCRDFFLVHSTFWNMAEKMKTGLFWYFCLPYTNALWIILGITVLKVLPDLSYSYFSGIWLFSELLLWIISHSMMEVKTFRRKNGLTWLVPLPGYWQLFLFAFLYISGICSQILLEQLQTKNSKVASCYLFVAFSSCFGEKIFLIVQEIFLCCIKRQKQRYFRYLTKR